MGTNQTKPPHTINLVLYGDPQIGTSQFIDNFTQRKESSTSIAQKTLRFKTGQRLQIILNPLTHVVESSDDKMMTSARLFRFCYVTMLCFDVCNMESFEHIDTLYETAMKYADHRKRVLFCLVGLKMDMRSGRVVDENEGRLCAERLGMVYKECGNVEEVNDVVFEVLTDVVKENDVFNDIREEFVKREYRVEGVKA